MSVDSNALRATMRQWVTGVTVVTTAFEGVRVGMTVSSFTSVSLEPPTVLVCLNKNAFAHDFVQRAGVFGVSLLSSDQAALSQRFAGLDPSITGDRFEGVPYITAKTGAPLLEGGVGVLDCVVRAAHEASTHTIYIGEVVYAQAFPERVPLIYYNRQYHNLVPQS
ncbi:MAG: flavin reductase [Candidatus Thermofonsia Clade 1 bacterium]|uniref:Flavin reductase n=1 Tax=Candidatus Thermofonsia Clade 1 bacterium TaxID=2364210 RepID=A0A2M8P2N3_9CHLR|nr:MAG: flavin reductase [Candidatus Thermofonsia Clade 1 bacterium]